ncbi:hypothetical protein [Oceanivirga salmonicida]|nr:hypothetical protein [Oceanivirga salmonicida]
MKILRKACENTFKFRESEYDIFKIKKLIIEISKNQLFIDRWNLYLKNNSYAEGISFENVINVIIDVINEIDK